MHAADHPAAPRRRRRPRRQAARRGHRGPGHVRRRRHQRGRLPRGPELRRRLPPAGRLLRAEQPVRHLACRWPTSPSRRRSPTRPSATAWPANGWTATTSSRSSPCWAGRSKLAREGSGPLLVEAHTYRMQAHTNADDATRYRQDSEVAAVGGPGSADPDGDLPARPRTAGRRRRAPDRREGGGGCRAAARRPRRGRPRWTRRTCSTTSSPTPTPQLQGTVRPARRRTAPRRSASDEAAHEPHRHTSEQRQRQLHARRRRCNRGACRLTRMADAMHVGASVFGEDVGMLGGVFRITDGLTADLRRAALLRHPAGRVRHRRHGRGHGHERHAPGDRDAVRRLRLPGLRADRQPRGQDAQPHPRARSKLPMVIRVPYAGGIGGVEHHCDSSESYYAHTAGLKVFTPATVGRRLPLLREAIDSDDPVMFMEPKKLYWSKDWWSTLAEHATRRASGRAAVARAGTDATLIAYGPSVPTALAAAAAAARGGPLPGSHRRPLHRAVRRRDRLRLGPQDRPCRGDRRGARLRRRVLGDRGPGPGALLPLPGRADPPRHRLRHPVPGAEARALLPARRGPHPRRR